MSLPATLVPPRLREYPRDGTCTRTVGTPSKESVKNRDTTPQPRHYTSHVLVQRAFLPSISTRGIGRSTVQPFNLTPTFPSPLPLSSFSSFFPFPFLSLSPSFPLPSLPSFTVQGAIHVVQRFLLLFPSFSFTFAFSSPSFRLLIFTFLLPLPTGRPHGGATAPPTPCRCAEPQGMDAPPSASTGSKGRVSIAAQHRHT